MPNIEIISLRFNLAKDIDRRLFEALKEQADNGKRNEFIKQVLFDRIVADIPEDKPDAGPQKKQVREPKERHGARRHSEVSESERAASPGPQASPQPVADVTAVGQATQGQESHREPNAEAAGLVSQFVQ